VFGNAPARPAVLGEQLARGVKAQPR